MPDGEASSGEAGPGLRPGSLSAALLPFSAVVFFGFLAIGVPLPVLPLEVHGALGYGSFVVGGVIGMQSIATLLTRPAAGRLCQTWGPKRTTLLGLGGASGAGVFYLLATLPGLSSPVSLGSLVAGRVLLGFGESLFITGTAVWSIGRVGVAHAGRAMAWQGMAMYGAMAVGAPLGSGLLAVGGFRSVSGVAVGMPLVGVLLALSLMDVAPQARGQASFLRVLRSIWRQGLGLALASSGFGTIAAFLALRFQAQGWANPGLALTAFGAVYIGVRLLFGGLPDRLGGGLVAAGSLLVEAVGLLMIWGAGSVGMAVAGTMVTGLGYSLVFPSLGVEAMRRTAPEDRGAVLAAFLACFDLGLGGAGPLAGLVAGAFGLPAAFLAAALGAVLSMGLVVAARRGGR